MRAASLQLADAQLALARWYGFENWEQLAYYAASAPTDPFEAAVHAVITGDEPTLAQLLRDHPGLIRQRSRRDHHATLVHYLAANGVEGHHQKTPKNAVAIARMLLESGAEPDALADMYDGKCTTMSMLVSSSPPADAGQQVPLVEILIDYGASANATGEGPWTAPLSTALVFNMRDAAEALVQRGAKIDHLETAAGLGRIDDMKRLLPSASALDRHRALALAAQQGKIDAVKLLIDAGEDINRYNPPGTHSHSPPIHQAVAAGQLEMVKFLVEHGARLDIRDTIWDGTPLGWAEYLKQNEITAYLRTVLQSNRGQ
jgi:ankyrin repeat protein